MGWQRWICWFIVVLSFCQLVADYFGHGQAFALVCAGVEGLPGTPEMDGVDGDFNTLSVLLPLPPSGEHGNANAAALQKNRAPHGITVLCGLLQQKPKRRKNQDCFIIRSPRKALTGHPT